MEVENENRVLEEVIAQNNAYIRDLELKKEKLELSRTSSERRQFDSRREEHLKKVDELLQKYNDDNGTEE